MIVLSLPESVVELLNLYLHPSTVHVKGSLANSIASAVAQAYSHQIGPARQEPPVNITPRIWNKNRSRYGGTCGECFGPIEQGEIVYLTEGTRARHLSCAPQPPDIIR